MKIRFIVPARQELDDAYEWYEREVRGLGVEFLDEIDQAVHRIKAFPESCEVLTGDMRRARLVRFPYGLIYGVDGEWIVIIAVAHLHREPFYWIDRSRELS